MDRFQQLSRAVTSERAAEARFLIAEALFIAAKLIRLRCGMLGCANAAEMERLLTGSNRVCALRAAPVPFDGRR